MANYYAQYGTSEAEPTYDDDESPKGTAKPSLEGSIRDFASTR